MARKNFNLSYRGSVLLLIFWIVVFFPVAFVLLFTDSTFSWGSEVYDLHYNGSRFWLCFWVLLFFPIAFLLLILNGMRVDIR